MPAPHIICLRNQFPWMGGHSGYDCLSRSLAAAGPGETTVQTVERLQREPGWMRRRRLSRMYWRVRSSELYGWASADAELRVSRALERRGDLAHIFYLEQDYGLLAGQGTRNGAALVGTAHQPPSWWRLRHEQPDLLGSLDAVLAVSSELADYASTFARGRTRFVPHGIDTAFFCPPRHRSEGTPRLLMTGQWLRDFECLARVLDIVLEQRPEIAVDLLVPRWRRADPVMLRIARHPQVEWHAGVTDEAMRALYHSAHALLLPLIDCTANNSLLEAMACGLPIVASDLPGVRDYAQDTFCTRVPPGDAGAMADAVLGLLEMPAIELDAQRHAAHAAALELDWGRVAPAVWAVYREVLGA